MAQLDVVTNPNTMCLLKDNINIDNLYDGSKVIYDNLLNKKNMAVRDVSDAVNQYTNNLGKYAALSPEEIYLDTLRIKSNGLQIDVNISDEARKFADEQLPETEKTRIAICVDASHPTTSLSLAIWNDLIKLCNKIDKFESVIFNIEEISKDVGEFKNIKQIKNSQNYEYMLACLDKADIVFTMDNSFSTLAKALGKQIVLIQGPRDASYKFKGYEKFDVLSKKSMFEQCLPCWVGPGGNCAMTGNPMALCLARIGAVEIFGKMVQKVNQLKKGDVLVAQH